MRRTSRNVRAVAVGVVALTTLSACGGTPPADEALAEAIATIDQGNSGTFAHSLEADGMQLLRSEGTYDLDAAVSSTTFTVEDETGTLESRTLVANGREFTQPDASAGPCWVASQAIGDDLVPAAVRTVLKAQGGTWLTEGATMVASVPALAVLESLGSLGAEAAENAALTRHSIDATVQIDDGEFVALSTRVAQVSDAIESTGRDVPAALEPFAAEGLDARVLVGVSDVGKAVDVQEPAAAFVVENRSALKKCNVRASK